MKKYTVKQILHQIKIYLIMTASIAILALGLHLFNFPNNFASGGMSGLAIVLSEFFNNFFALDLSPADFVSVINIILLTIGFIFIGRDFGVKTVYCSLLLSGLLELFEFLIPITAPITDNPLLELLFAVVIVCIGQSIVFNVGGSTGGFDIIGMIIRKFFKIDIGKAILIADLVVVAAGFFVFDPQTGLYSLLGALLAPLIIDTSIENFNMSKYFIIVTTKPDEIAKYITEKLDRGATRWDAEGCFTGEKKTMIMVVMNRFQSRRLRAQIKEIDPHAFILVSNSSDIIGEGFKPSK